MNCFWIGAGFVFLLNPILGISDVLPDFIGILLIIFGIRDASYVIERLSVARRRFTYLVWISVARLAISFLGIDSINTLPLTITFSLALIEGMLLVLALGIMFDGIEYGAMLYGGTGIFSQTKMSGGKARDTIGRLKVFAIVLFIWREVLSVIPELPALQLSDYTGDVAAFDFSSVGLLIRVAVSVAFILPAIVFFWVLVRFLRKLSSAKEMQSGIANEIKARFGDVFEPRMCSRMRTVEFFAGAAVLLYMGFYDYQINSIPRFVPALIVIFVSFVLFAASGRNLFALSPVIPAVLTFPVSIITNRLQESYYSHYKTLMLQSYLSDDLYIYDQHINRIKPGYYKLAASEMCEALFCGAAIVLMLIVYHRLAVSHGEAFRSVPNHDRSDIRAMQKRRFTMLMISSALSIAFFAAYRFVLPYFASMPMTCIAINLINFGVYLYYSLMNNQYVYGNIQ